MHSHTKFGIPFSNNIRDMLLTQLLLKQGQRSRSRWPKNIMWDSTIPRCIYKEYKRYALNTKILKTRSEVKVKVTQNGMCDTLSSQDAFRHQIWNSYLKEYRRYTPDLMQFLEIRSEVKFKVTVTQLLYVTLFHPKMHSHTKFEIPTSNNLRDMLRKRLFLKLGHRSSSRSQWPNYGMRHFVISRCIITINLRFLSQILLEICSGHDYSNN